MFKGNVTNLLGACYRADDPERDRGFSLFYISVNLGSFLATITCGDIAHLYGWHYGFGLAGIGMVMGLVTFIRFQDLLGDNGLPPRPELMTKLVFGLMLVGSFLLAILVSKMLISSEFFANILTFSGVI